MIVFGTVAVSALGGAIGVVAVWVAMHRIEEVMRGPVSIANFPAIPTRIAVDGLEELIPPDTLSVRLIDMEMVPMEYKVHRRVRVIPKPVELNSKPMVSAKL